MHFKKIGLVTCKEKPQLTAGDQVLARRLTELGASVSSVVWTNPLTEKWDALIIRSTWDYHLHHTDFIRWLRQAQSCTGQIINSVETILWNLDKSYLAELAKNQVPCVPTIFGTRNESVAEIIEQIKNSGWDEIVLKPSISATAFLTHRSTSSATDLTSILAKIKAHSGVLVQPFLTSIGQEGELSLTFFCGKSMEYSHSVLKTPQAGDYRVQSDFGGLEIIFTASKDLIHLAQKALENIPGEWRFARVDILRWQHDPIISESELIEPDLYFHLFEDAAERFAANLID